MFKRELVCRSCGTVGKTKRKMPGSIIIELALWCAFIVPGLIYSIYRHMACKQVCRICESPEMIPKDSPLAKIILKQVGS